MTSGAAVRRQEPSRAAVPYADFSWREAFDAIRTHLPPALVSRAQALDLDDYCVKIPGLWNWGMLEFRLAAGEPTIDVLGCSLRGTASQEAIRKSLDEKDAPLLEGSAPLAAWCRSGDAGVGASGTFWMEWDRTAGSSVPLSWICLDPKFFNLATDEPEDAAIRKLLAAYLESSPDHDVPGAIDCLLELRSSLPRGGQVTAVASLGPRGQKVCRAFVRVPGGEVIPWLKRIEWPGDIAAVTQFEDLYAVAGEDRWVQLECDSKLQPSLALELAQTERGFPRREARERWLKQVVKHGWAEPDRAEAVLDWQGGNESELTGEGPVELLRSFHLKLALSPGEAPRAKAYLGFYFRRQPEDSGTAASRGVANRDAAHPKADILDARDSP